MDGWHMNGNMERIWKEVVMAYLGFYPGICLKPSVRIAVIRPKFEQSTSRIWVKCVTDKPTRSVLSREAMNWTSIYILRPVTSESSRSLK
jgi:hypothetical protein